MQKIANHQPLSIQTLLKALLPKLDQTFYKGQNGKVGVIGGSKDYTGAPYYAGAASLKAGADISHIFCADEAGIPIKCYSPELIVHPCLHDSEELIKWLSACTSIIIGPGLGREENFTQTLRQALKQIIDLEKVPIVGDADFLWYLSNSNERLKIQTLVSKFQHNAILTPNIVESQRLYGEGYNPTLQSKLEQEFLSQHIGTIGIINNDEEIILPLVELAKRFNNTIILKKGVIDLISDGKKSYYCAVQGGMKRCGGQGDILAGMIGAFVNFKDNLSEMTSEDNEKMMLAALSASAVNRQASKFAYDKFGLSLTSPDILKHLHKILNEQYKLDHLFKLVLLGDSCVGKSCLLDDEFFENYISTIGVDFWDTAGQERYRTITNAYYRGADGIILVFDLFKKDSFANLQTWIQEVEKHAKNDVEIIIIGNKSDRAQTEHAEVTEQDIQKFMNETGLKVYVASAKTGENVESSFLTITSSLISKAQSQVRDSIYKGSSPKKMKETQASKLGASKDGMKAMQGCCLN